LRTAQIAALEGRAADVRAADEAHRRAIADAVAPPEPPGRLTHLLQPGGFEALAGIRVRDTGSGRTHASAPTTLCSTRDRPSPI